MTVGAQAADLTQNLPLPALIERRYIRRTALTIFFWPRFLARFFSRNYFSAIDAPTLRRSDAPTLRRSDAPTLERAGREPTPDAVSGGVFTRRAHFFHACRPPSTRFLRLPPLIPELQPGTRREKYAVILNGVPGGFDRNGVKNRRLKRTEAEGAAWAFSLTASARFCQRSFTPFRLPPSPAAKLRSG